MDRSREDNDGRHLQVGTKNVSQSENARCPSETRQPIYYFYIDVNVTADKKPFEGLDIILAQLHLIGVWFTEFYKFVDIEDRVLNIELHIFYKLKDKKVINNKTLFLADDNEELLTSRLDQNRLFALTISKSWPTQIKDKFKIRILTEFIPDINKKNTQIIDQESNVYFNFIAVDEFYIKKNETTETPIIFK